MISRFGWKCFLVVAVALLCRGEISCFGQFQPPPPEADGFPPVMMIVPPSRETLQALNHAREALKQHRTAEAIQLLQRLIELPEDHFTDKSMQRTLKSETLDILANLSAAERESYELLRGTPAKTLLEEAETEGSLERWEEIVRRYPLTEASLDAAERLAIEAQDRGNIWQAAVQFERLRRSPLVSQAQSRQLMLREALAWQEAGQTSRATELLQELSSLEPKLRAEIAGQPLPVFKSVEQAGRWLAQVSRPARMTEPASVDWLTPRGSADGTSSVGFAGPIGGPAWHQNHLAALEADLSSAPASPLRGFLSRLLDEAESQLAENERLAWPAAMPLVVGDQIIFRTPRDIVALDRRTGEERWRSVLTDADFDRLWSKTVKEGETPELKSDFVSFLRELIFDNRLIGSLSSDGHLVFALAGEDSQSAFQAQNNINNMRGIVPQPDADADEYNRLVAYEAEGGRVAWEIDGERRDANQEFAGHFFLGPPVAGDGKLFILAEVQGEIRLVMLEASDHGVRKLWSQPLAAPSLKITDAPDRRRQALMPAVSNGIAICPTGTGAVIAVDYGLRRLVWAYQYPSTDDINQLMNSRGGMFVRVNPATVTEESSRGWIDGNPMVADGRVFITPTDSDELHCLDLADGEAFWTVPRDRAVFLAGADRQRAVLIGPERIDAIDVTDGKPAWKEAVLIPTPAGRGVWMQDRYSLPLATGEIATVDLVQGRILARSRIPEGRLPGNLVVGAGGLVSLSVREVIAFRPQAETERLLTQKLAADPQAADALALRGELKLHRGEFDAGLADLRAAIAGRPEPYVKSVLAAALLEGLRTSFPRYRETVPELDTLTDDPQQRNEFLWLVARGLKEAGEPLAAFERMTHLIDQSLDEYSVEGTGSPWQARNDRRLSGHFAALYQQATPAERRKLDAQILARMPNGDRLAADDSVAALRRYLRTFGFHASAAKARAQLIARFNPETDALEYVHELSRLAQASDDATAAPAVGRLARWCLTQKRFNDVGFWSLELEGRFGAIPCEPGLTGQQLAAELRSDPDYVESRKQLVIPWPEGEIDKEHTTPHQQGGRMKRVQIVDPIPPQYAGWSFETDPQGIMLIARDEYARHQWTLNRANPAPANQAFFSESQPALHRIHLCGHLIGWSTGSEFLIAADLEQDRMSPRVLWHETLMPPGGNINWNMNRIVAMQRAQMRGRRRGMIWNQPFLYNIPPGAGALVALTDSAVIYHNGRKLFAADPLTGKLLWSRKDVTPSLAEIAADEEAVAVLSQADVADEDSERRESTLTLLRTIDGERIRRTEPVMGVVEWIGGSRVVASEGPGQSLSGPVPLELLDLIRGKPVWQAKLARPAAIRVVNQSDLFTIEENRRLSLRNLQDGAVRWTQDLDLDVEAETLRVQPWHDRYLVIVGTTTPVPGGPQALDFRNEHDPIQGHVAALDRGTGKLLWQTPINDPVTGATVTVFDPAQPAGWPVLLFAGQLQVPPPPGVAAPMIRRLTVTFIDKRTGRREYSLQEPSQVADYFVDVDPDLNRMVANFITWSLNLRYTGKPAK